MDFFQGVKLVVNRSSLVGESRCCFPFPLNNVILVPAFKGKWRLLFKEYYNNASFSSNFPLLITFSNFWL